ncbi:MAG: alpha-2-macroglobulin family protein, partial [Dehalococcoidia bacterium]|nr:alpha-2-macroglobulin family protein [Dehalococcoidia bacterium]
ASGSDMVYWKVENNDRIDLVADKPSYKPGETAKVLIPSPFPKAKALLTIERGHIMAYQTIDINSTSQVVEIPVESAHVPNVFVSIVLLRSEADGDGRADFKMGYVELPVRADEKKLNISITPDKAKYQPRDTATYKIKTTDYQGKPVQAEISVAMVDASVLSLAEEKVRDLFDSFYGRRSLSVRTAQTLSKALSKVNPELMGGGKGGGGDPENSRGYFPDVAYWNPTVKTDSNGEATVSVPLPDTLTTWRLTARGATVDTIVGAERNDIVVSKQVLIRPVVPRFLIVGDEPRLEAIVHNYTQATLEADVSLSAQGMTIDGQKSLRVKIAPSGTAKVAWIGKVGKDREASLTFRVQPVSPQGAPKDAVDVTLPVLAYSAPEITATSGEVKTTVTEAV